MVSISKTRKAVVVEYEGVKGDTVNVRSENPEVELDDDHRVSWRDADNNGAVAVQFPIDHVGPCEITVTGDEGTADTGVIEVT